jgi:hypothetical protein
MYVNWFIWIKLLIILLYSCSCIMTIVLPLSACVVINLCSLVFFFMSFRVFKSYFAIVLFWVFFLRRYSIVFAVVRPKRQQRSNKYNSSSICKLKCMDCSLQYIGHTWWPFQTRHKEHIYAIRYNKYTTSYAQQILNTGHSCGNIQNTVEIILWCIDRLLSDDSVSSSHC